MLLCVLGALDRLPGEVSRGDGSEDAVGEVVDVAVVALDEGVDVARLVTVRVGPVGGLVEEAGGDGAEPVPSVEAVVGEGLAGPVAGDEAAPAGVAERGTLVDLAPARTGVTTLARAPSKFLQREEAQQSVKRSELREPSVRLKPATRLPDHRDCCCREMHTDRHCPGPYELGAMKMAAKAMTLTDSATRFSDDIRRGHGFFWLAIRPTNIQVSQHSSIWASIHELEQPPGQPTAVPAHGDGHPRMTIHNVVPDDDGMAYVMVQIDAPHDVLYRVHLFISNQ
jgi:hypothetical protein